VNRIVPPIKSQGIKTKLAAWIASVVPPFAGRWIEPFVGTGAVAFNLAPQRALLGDINPHAIGFYQAVAAGKITSEIAETYLRAEGDKLRTRGEAHYYAVRDRFNLRHDPLDFLFLNRACFNGMIRFNRSGAFNVPFCRKPNRFAPSYVTKIVHQIAAAAALLKANAYVFACQPFEQTLAGATADDIVYCDPPYIGRYADYYNGWDEVCEHRLFDLLDGAPCRFILSTWHHNAHRSNGYVRALWGKFPVLTKDHFYHVGARETNRNPMVEALITNFAP